MGEILAGAREKKYLTTFNNFLGDYPPRLFLNVSPALRQQYFNGAWWSFAPSSLAILGIPVELYLGWAVSWGLVPQLGFHKLDPPEVLVLMGLLDLWIMPFCRPVILVMDASGLGPRMLGQVPRRPTI